jgi:predicted O-linked N-acetylglucosamine transferase (SPINDLY family)
VVTLRGQHFASRVATSILHELGLDELIVSDLTAYRDLVLQLVADKELRDSLRGRLTTKHLQSTLFNTQDYVHRAEDLFEQMHSLQRQELRPQMLWCRK